MHARIERTLLPGQCKEQRAIESGRFDALETSVNICDQECIELTLPLAKEKNLKVAVGLQRHHQKGYLETLKRLHDGAIGDITSMRCYWNGATPWLKKREDLEKQYGRKLTEMEYQMRNWYYFTWICGDHICEQHIHNLDVINWVKKGWPVIV